MEPFAMQDIELRSIDVSSPLMRTLNLNEEDGMNFDKINTKYGQITVYKQGISIRPNKPVLITYHDIGLNHVSNFQAFFNYSDVKLMLQSISVLHINAPGQEENSPVFPDDYIYPTLDELSEQILDVCHFYNVSSFIGFGVGVGASILSRFALQNPKYLDGMFLMNPTASAASWAEWFYQKFNIYYLGLSGSSSLNNSFPETARNYLMWYHFGKLNQDRSHDLIELYRNYFISKIMNAKNLALFIDSHIKRTDLGIDRNDSQKNIKCPVLLMCGALSPHVEDSINMNARLNPANSTWIKLQDCGMVLEEQPGKVAEALKLFIQGLGYPLTAYERRKSSFSKTNINNQQINYNCDPNFKIYNNSKDFNFKLDKKDLINNSNENGLSVKINFSKNQEDVHIVENPIPQC